MSILAMAGAETGHRTAEGLVANGGAATSDTAVKRGSHAHTASWKFTAQNAVANLRNIVSFGGTVGRWYWLRCYVYSPSGTVGLPNSTKRIMLFSNATAPGTGLGWAVGLRPDRSLVLVDGAGIEQGTPVALTADTFTLVEFGLQINGSGGTDFAELWINGVQAHSVSGSVTDLAVNFAQFGWINAPNNVAADKTVYMDDVLVNDDQGSDFNGRRGEGAIGYLAPVADIARVGWTDGNAGTSNLFGSLDNIPPIGEAVTGTTAASQIEDAQNNNTDDFTAEVEDYDTAAIPSNRRIRAVRAIATVGSSSLTGSNDGNLRLTLNPADATADATSVFNFDASGAVAAAFPTGWQGVAGAVVYDPNPTRSTRPRWRIGRREAANRTMAACSGGVQVEYGDIRVPVAQATETDTAGQLTPRKTKAIGQVTETGTAGQISAAKRVPVAQATETDAAGQLTARKTKAFAAAEETDTAPAATSRKTKAIGEAEEADSAQAVSRPIPVGQASEADSAGALAAQKTLTTGQASEQDTAEALTRVVGQATEADTADTVVRGGGGAQTVPVGQASEQDIARPTVVVLYLFPDVYDQTEDESIVFEPTLIAGQLLEVDEMAVATPVVYSPTIASGSLIEPDEGPASSVVVFSPSLAMGSPIYPGAGPSGAPVVFEPSLIQGQFLEPGTPPAGTPTVFQPSLAHGQALVVDTRPGPLTPTVYEPSLAHAQALQVDTRPGPLTPTVFEPSLAGSQFLYVDELAQLDPATVFEPSLQTRPPSVIVADDTTRRAALIRTAR